MAYLRKSVEKASTLSLHSNLNGVSNANAPQKEHKQIVFMAISKGGVSKVVQKGREAKRQTKDKIQLLQKSVWRNN